MPTKGGSMGLFSIKYTQIFLPSETKRTTTKEFSSSFNKLPERENLSNQKTNLDLYGKECKHVFHNCFFHKKRKSWQTIDLIELVQYKLGY